MKKWIGIVACFLFVFVLAGCQVVNLSIDKETKGKSSTGNQAVSNWKGGSVKFLTATVYNATVSHLEDQDVVTEEFIESIPSDHEFTYEQIQVYNGYAFKTMFDFQFKPYFENDYTDQEIDVIISLFGLYSEKAEAWYEQKMIIFKTDLEMVGFLCPQWGMIDELNPFTVNLSNLYFESPMLLTNNEVVKYYEPGDYLYTFKANLSDSTNIILEITSELAFETERETVSNRVVQGSYVELGSSEVLEIMDMAKIEKVNIEATITSIDPETGLLYVSSNDAPTLQTVEVNDYEIYDVEGNAINMQDLQVGDVLHIYYFKRYSSYNPINILVHELIVEKLANGDELKTTDAQVEA